jgi:hypothetical protein
VTVLERATVCALGYVQIKKFNMSSTANVSITSTQSTVTLDYNVRFIHIYFSNTTLLTSSCATTHDSHVHVVHIPVLLLGQPQRAVVDGQGVDRGQLQPHIAQHLLLLWRLQPQHWFAPLPPPCCNGG